MMGTEDGRARADEVKDVIAVGKPYVLITKGGKEHNVVMERVGIFYLFGRVALNKVVVLVDRPGGGGAVVKVVAPQEEKSAVGHGDELIHSEPCVVESRSRIIVAIDSVSILEDPWRPFVPTSSFLPNGAIDCDALCEVIPAFAAYRIPGKGFATSFDDCAKPKLKDIRQLNVADEDSSSE